MLTSLQSQRKLASSTLTLILFQHFWTEHEKHYFVVAIAMTTVELVDLGIIVSLVHVEE